MAGYSATPLPQKLGIKPGMVVVLINAPRNYRNLLDLVPLNVKFAGRANRRTRLVHLFTMRRVDLVRRLSILRRQIADDAVFWVSWPKKSSGVVTDVTEDVVREIALPLGFVDVKVCAIDEVWSGLKLVVRRSERRSTLR